LGLQLTDLFRQPEDGPSLDTLFDNLKQDQARVAGLTAKGRRAFRQTFIRQWREHRQMTLEQLAQQVGISYASLSRIERGVQPYSQMILEALAEALQTDVACLLVCEPADGHAIWSIWEQAKPQERRLIVDLANTVTKARAIGQGSESD
jgi:transcriptional regulator with XRE-family HTH domain